MDIIVIHCSMLSLCESTVLVGTPHYFLATHSNAFTWLNVSILLSVVNLCRLWYTLYSSGNKRSNIILTAILYLHFLWLFKTKIVLHTSWLWDTFFYFLWYTPFSYVEITKRILWCFQNYVAEFSHIYSQNFLLRKKSYWVQKFNHITVFDFSIHSHRPMFYVFIYDVTAYLKFQSAFTYYFF